MIFGHLQKPLKDLKSGNSKRIKRDVFLESL